MDRGLRPVTALDRPSHGLDDALQGAKARRGHPARDLARREGIAEDGYRLIINCNRHGGQEVYHLHLHLLGGKPLGPMVSA